MNFVEYIPQEDPKGFSTLISNQAAIDAAMSGGTVSQRIAFRGGSKLVAYPEFVRVVQSAGIKAGRTPTSSEVYSEGINLGVWVRGPSLWESTFKPLLQTAAQVGVVFAAGAALSAGAGALGMTPAATGAATAATGAATTSAVAATAATTTAAAATVTGGIVNTTLGTTVSGWLADAAAIGVSVQGLQQTFTPAKAAPAAAVAAQTPNNIGGGITTKQAVIGVGGLVLAIILIRAVI